MGGYRKDIDSLRTIAVLSVIVFHFGYLPYGYLGVDVFFVISGYLITKIITREIENDKFSIKNFYIRRIRRILPLVFLVTAIAFVIGYFVMLPDDFENLVQSIVATNFFGNNVLQFITTGNYWDVVNEYKPLMHTWSLGVEEQFYLLYPLIFLILGKSKKLRKYLLPTIIVLTLISILLFISPMFSESAKFYLLPFRFFEISIGGIGALILKDKLLKHKFTPLLILSLFLLLFWNVTILNDSIRLILVVLITLVLLVSSNNKSILLNNNIMVYIGKISFSLYLWHQLVVAFARYTVFEELTFIDIAILTIIIFALSIMSYHLVEQPFRNKVKFPTPKLIWTLATGFTITTALSLIIFSQAGVVRDVPELDISEENAQRGLHAEYNSKIYNLDKDFSENDRTKIFIVGNSFARDWANVILESERKNNVDITYTDELINTDLNKERLDEAEYIFFSELERETFDLYKEDYNIDESKVWNVGTKNFGTNNGVYYSKRGTEDYFNQRTNIMSHILERNVELKDEWGDRYIDLVSMVIDENNKVPVFTTNQKFISQDTRHLTEAGAQYYGQLIDFDRITKE